MALGVSHASLLGLPAELRLEIFSYLSEPLRFHVDSAGQDLDRRKWTFTHKRLCYTPDPVHPSLCTTPCFSGLVSHNSICQNLGGKHTHRLAIRGVCKLFLKETNDVLNTDLFSLTLVDHLDEARSVLKSMSAQRLEMLVELTIQVLPGGRHREWGDVSRVVVYLRHHRTAFPNLRTIAIQAPQRFRKLSHSQVDPVHYFDPEGEWRWQWPIVELKKTFRNRAQIIFEGWIVLRAGHMLCSGTTDEMMRVRGIFGNCSAESGCECTFESVTEPVVEDIGPWTEYWRSHAMGFDRAYPITRRWTYDKSKVLDHRKVADQERRNHGRT
jgi:hypothetical protein